MHDGETRHERKSFGEIRRNAKNRQGIRNAENNVHPRKV